MGCVYIYMYRLKTTHKHQRREDRGTLGFWDVIGSTEQSACASHLAKLAFLLPGSGCHT